MLESTQI